MRRCLGLGLAFLLLGSCGGCADPSASMPLVGATAAAQSSPDATPSAGVCMPCGGTEIIGQAEDKGYPAPQWQTFAAADGSFRLDAPAPIPDEERVAVDGTAMRGGRVNVAGVNYVAAYSTPPEPRDFLRRSVASLVSVYRASSQRGPVIGGVPSTLMTYALKGGKQARHLLWSDGRLLLQLIVIGPAGAPTEAERFQGSVVVVAGRPTAGRAAPAR